MWHSFVIWLRGKPNQVQNVPEGGIGIQAGGDLNVNFFTDASERSVKNFKETQAGIDRLRESMLANIKKEK